MSTMHTPVNYLFVPGDHPERFDKALASCADAVILDLEDAVSGDAKEPARAAIARWIAARPNPHVPVAVRINAVSTLCIHPRQVAGVRAALQPTQAELEWAQRVIAAAEQHEGAVQLDGRMVDRPVFLRAKAIVERARHVSGAAQFDGG
jgi:citrate lyase beta subunit